MTTAMRLPGQDLRGRARSSGRTSEGTGATVEPSGVRSSSGIVAFCASAVVGDLALRGGGQLAAHGVATGLEPRARPRRGRSRAGVQRRELYAKAGDPLRECVERAWRSSICTFCDTIVPSCVRRVIASCARACGTRRVSDAAAGIAGRDLRADDVAAEITGDAERLLRRSRDRVAVRDLEGELGGVALCTIRRRRWRRRRAALACGLGARVAGDAPSARLSAPVVDSYRRGRAVCVRLALRRR